MVKGFHGKVDNVPTYPVPGEDIRCAPFEYK